MWTKPYGMKEGFLIGGGLIIVGLMLQLSSGPVDWNAFRWPVNGIVLAGFLWAKEAWGHYWSWDPKETWAAITWFAYLIYVHYRKTPNHQPRLAMWILLISFVLLQMCWWGIKLLPHLRETSVHLYSN